jgi:hypothetical protein
MLSAMVASTGADGMCTTPSAASPRVRLWATVKAVMVRHSLRQLGVSRISPSTKAR